MTEPFVGSDPLREALVHALGAQYDVLKLLGRGGMGAVYLARERLLERLVAIKVLPRENADGDARERFLREARTAAQLSHPNTVSLLSFGELGDTLFYVMRYVEGESLETRLARDGTIPEDEARVILSELADALAEAHRLGIVHRDIKPDNVMIERSTGRALLTDFGIARQHSGNTTLTGTGIVVGTPQYMSPEQAAGDKAIDGRSDLYSLGVLGYRMLTGRLPFVGGDVREMLYKQMTADPTAIAALAPDVPVDLSDALMRCLAKDPSARWTDAQSLRFALQANADSFEMPDTLENVPRIGTRAVLMTYGWSIVLLGLFAWTRYPEWLYVGGLVGSVGLGATLLTAVLAGKKAGVSIGRTLRMAFWPSQGSTLWWPRQLRPPGDVFDRLPPPVQRARVLLSLSVLAITLVAPCLIIGAFLVTGREPRYYLFLSGLGAMQAGLFILLGSLIGPSKWKKRWSITATEAKKLLHEPTHGSRFWERPSIAALLSKFRPGKASRAMTVEGMAHAVRELAAGLPPAAATIAQGAARAATDLQRELVAIDERMLKLSPQGGPAEQKRLADRLAEIGPVRPDESDLDRQMRNLLQGQASLFAQLDDQRNELQARRSRLQEELRTLWLQMANYRAQMDAQGDLTDLSEAVRELSHTIERRVAAIKETEQIGGGV